MIDSAPPAESADVVKVATPFVTAALPWRLPCLKLTVPVGVPPDDVTVAVNVTDCPYMEGFGLEVSVRLVVFLAAPMPLSAIDCVAPIAFSTLSVNTAVPWSVPVVVGIKLMLKLHIAPAASEEPPAQSDGVPEPAT